MKKIPMRMCVVTKEKLPKKDLMRILNTDEGIIVDDTGKINGHGCYMKKDIEVIEMARKKKILDHVFSNCFEDSVYDLLIEKIK